MGQYYKPCILADKTEETENEKVIGWMLSHNYDNGLKLMEHSWMRNRFVNTFEKLLSSNGGYAKKRVVWAGDYADDENGIIDQEGGGVNLYQLCEDNTELKPKEVKRSYYRYILNHTTKQFVDKTKVPTNYWTDEKGKKWPFAVHPLPLLTCEGNGRGGGDYHGDDIENVGIWARHSISVSSKIPWGFIELVVKFKE